jgi:hypothetical protein
MPNHPIGGFFELELSSYGESYHSEAIALSTGRGCIRLMIQNLSISKCYLPFYACDAVYDPFLAENIDFEYYQIDERLEPKNLPDLKENEYFFYINYFGIKSDAVALLIKKYGEKLLLDNTHAFFKKAYSGNWSFTSARKYFGVPDGAYLYSPSPISYDSERFIDFTALHNILKLNGNQSEGFKEYQRYESTLDSNIYSISYLSERLLAVVDYETVKEKRIKNFQFLHEQLGAKNFLAFDPVSESNIPFVYPFRPHNPIEKLKLYNENIFFPALWTEVINKAGSEFEWEKKFSSELLPLPIDHRYSVKDMEFIVSHINKLI